MGTAASTVPGVGDAAFNQIRQAGRADAAATLGLRETIGAVGRDTRDPAFLVRLRRQAEAIQRGSCAGLKDENDRADADERHRAAVAILRRQHPHPSPLST